MRITRVKYFIDVGMLISFIACFITGIVKWPGLIRFFGISHLTLPLYQISLIHDRSGLILGILVLAHLVLNWKWIVATTRDIRNRGW